MITLKANQLVRLDELSTSLKSISFPFKAPLNPNLLESLAGGSKNLDFFDKFSGKRVEYGLEHVQVPSNLHFIGDNWQALNVNLCVAFGGTSSPVADSVWITTLLAQIVANVGGTVISGGATGIDTAAHMGALDMEGCTVAVLADNLNSGLYPYEARRLWLEKAIKKNGGLISEYKDSDSNYGGRALQRDRIITALSDVFVAVECGHDSATVDTAKRALIQGRHVFAIQWDFVCQQWRKSKALGNTQLFRELIARPIPSKPTKSLEEIGQEFWEIIKKIESKHRNN